MIRMRSSEQAMHTGVPNMISLFTDPIELEELVRCTSTPEERVDAVLCYIRPGQTHQNRPLVHERQQRIVGVHRDASVMAGGSRTAPTKPS
jgi:hypothetical protein